MTRDVAAASAADWWSGHLHYHQDIDEVIRSVVAPVTTTLDREGFAWFFLRYWDGGTHVRLRVLAPRPDDRARADLLVSSHMSDLVARQPSNGGLSAAEYEQIATYLAAREGTADHVPHLRPDNQVHVVPYEREHERFGEGASIQAVETHFVESSRLAIGLLDDSMRTPETVAFTMLVATQRVLGRYGLLSEESLRHAREAWREPTNSLPALDPVELERRFESQRASLVAAASSLWNAGESPGPNDDWQGSLSRLLESLRDADSSQIGGVIDVCAHLLCNRLGVSMPTEIYLRTLATRAVEEFL